MSAIQETRPRPLMDRVTQVLLPLFTIGEFALMSVKLPQFALLSSVLSLPFWFYNSWTVWSESRRGGALVSTAVTAIFILLGVTNYWLLS